MLSQLHRIGLGYNFFLLIVMIKYDFLIGTHTKPLILCFSQAVYENSEMSREVPRLRGILVNKTKRIGQLEHMIEETREAANSEREKLRLELHQTRAGHQARLRDKKRESGCGLKR